MRRFSKDHEWVELEGAVARIGITEYAQKALGDVVYVELPKLERDLAAGEAAAVVESVKAASDVYAPLAGKVLAVNEALAAEPALVNADPENKAWFFTLTLTDPAAFAAMMDEAAYAAYVKGLA